MGLTYPGSRPDSNLLNKIVVVGIGWEVVNIVPAEPRLSNRTYQHAICLDGPGGDMDFIKATPLLLEQELVVIFYQPTESLPELRLLLMVGLKERFSFHPDVSRIDLKMKIAFSHREVPFCSDL